MKLLLLLIRASWLMGLTAAVLSAASGMATLALIALIHQALSTPAPHSVQLPALFTGACAAVVAGILRGLLDSPVEVITRGGIMHIAWAPGQSVMMTGPAVTVFASEIEVPD